MKTSLNLGDFAAEVKSRAERKEDFVGDTRLMELVDGETLTIGNGREFKLNDHAHSQLGEALKIPASYYNRLRTEMPDLLSTNVNKWFHKTPAKRMIRTLDGTGRAIVSDRFNRMDDDAFTETVFPAISDIPGAEIKSCAITDTKTHIKFVSARLEREVKRGDIVQFGIAFSNSEVGAGKLTGSLLAYQLICSNGMVMEDEQFASTHIGKRHTTRNLEEIFKLDTLAADGAATILKLRDFAAEILTDRFIDAKVEEMRALTRVKVADPVAAVQTLAKRHVFTEGTQRSVLNHLIEGGDLSMWGLQNAVTRAASDEDDYNEATRLETIGGRMLKLAKPELRELAMAA